MCQTGIWSAAGVAPGSTLIFSLCRVLDVLNAHN